VKSQRMTLPLYDLRGNDDTLLLIKQALVQEAGVKYVYVNADTEMAYVEYDPAMTSQDKVVAVVEQAGFHVGKPGMR